jgi:nucleotide-binding universal stress UspA family protein
LARFRRDEPVVRRLQSLVAMETKSSRKLLVAIDFSAGSYEALEQAIVMAKRSASKIEILHVIEPVHAFPLGTPYLDAGYATLYEDVNRELSHCADRVRSAGLACVTKILEGSASSEVTKHGHDIGADLIVVGTHGRTGIAHAMLGSVAERIVRRASCPVLTVPHSRKAA